MTWTPTVPTLWSDARILARITWPIPVLTIVLAGASTDLEHLSPATVLIPHAMCGAIIGRLAVERVHERLQVTERLVAERLRPGRWMLAIVGGLGGGLLAIQGLELIGWILLMATPEFAVTILDGSDLRFWIARILAGTLALVPGVATGVVAGWLNAMAFAPLSWFAPESATLGGLLLSPTFVAGHIVVASIALWPGIRQPIMRRPSAVGTCAVSR